MALYVIFSLIQRLDCEQSLFFFRFIKGRARAKRGRQSVKKNIFSCLSHLAPSVTRVTICVSRVLLEGLQKQERLLVAYTETWGNSELTYYIRV